MVDSRQDGKVRGKDVHTRLAPFGIGDDIAHKGLRYPSSRWDDRAEHKHDYHRVVDFDRGFRIETHVLLSIPSFCLSHNACQDIVSQQVPGKVDMELPSVRRRLSPLASSSWVSTYIADLVMALVHDTC